MKLWPFCIRIGLEFDAIDVQQAWWLPWFHSWRFGCRVGVLGVHLIVGVSFLHDYRGCPHGVGCGLECGACLAAAAAQLASRAGVNVAQEFCSPPTSLPWCDVCRSYHSESTPHVDADAQ